MKKLTRAQVRKFAEDASARLFLMTGKKPKDEWVEHEIERMYQLGHVKYGKAEKDAGNKYLQDDGYEDEFTKMNDILKEL